MPVKELEHSLKNLLEKERALCITINGAWGVGKTFFWTKFVEREFKETKETLCSLFIKEFYRCFNDIFLEAVKQLKEERNTKVAIYISLFGKETLQQIRSDLLLQIYSQNSLIKRLKDFLGSSKLGGIDASAVLSCIERKDFENVIVCFDDFERLSDKLSLKDVLGLISELKEQKNCNVIMILNDGKLAGDGNNDLDTYKDKIVDYEFHYEPSPKESFDLIKDELDVFDNYALEFFIKFNIKNIRNMRRVVNALNDYKFIQNEITKDSDFEREIVNLIIGISYVNATSQVKFKELEDYNKRYYGGVKSPENTEYDKLLKYLTFGGKYRFNIGDQRKNIISYSRSSIVDEDAFKVLIKDEVERRKRSKIHETLQCFIKRSRNDLQYSNESYVKEMFDLLEKNKNKLVGLVSTDNFLFYMNDLIKFDRQNAKKYRIFAVSVLKEYLDVIHEEYIYKGSVDKIVAFDKKLNSYYNELKVSGEVDKITTKNGVLELMLKPRSGSLIKEDGILLSKVEIQCLKKYLLEDSDFMWNSRNFIDWVNEYSSSGYNIGFEAHKEKMLTAMREIEQEGNQDQKLKLEMILESLQVK